MRLILKLICDSLIWGVWTFITHKWLSRNEFAGADLLCLPRVVQGWLQPPTKDAPVFALRAQLARWLRPDVFAGGHVPAEARWHARSDDVHLLA